VQGHHSNQFIPLAENLEFAIAKNELVCFNDDEKGKSHFSIQRMVLREEWERELARRELTPKVIDRGVNYQYYDSPRASVISTSAR
jgi:hypothetical protein